MFKSDRIMKKFWNLISALCVVLGVAGCSTVDGDVLDSVDGGFSFIATIDHTRADVVNNDGVWQTVWSGDDILYVTSDKGNFVFANSAERPSRFVAEDEGAEVLREASNIVIATQHEGGCVVDSDAGKRGLALRGEYASFPEDGRVSLGVESAFFRLSCTQQVTLEADAPIFSGVDGSSDKQVNGVTVGAGSDIWVAFEPCVEKVALTVTVAGKVEKSVEELALSPCVIYTIGEIVPTVEPEPEVSYIYLVPNDEWMSDGAWFVAYFLNGNGDTEAVKLSDEYGVYEAAVPEGMTTLVFYRMNPAYTEFGVNDLENTRIWAETSLLDVGVAPYNYFYITGDSTGEWNSAGYKPNLPNEPTPPDVYYDKWAVAGTFNGWGDEPMTATDEQYIFVKRSLWLDAGAEFKIKVQGSWAKNYGSGEPVTLRPNEWVLGFQDGHNIPVAYSGAYDIYLDAYSERIFLMRSGVDYTSAVEQGTAPEEPAPSTDSWGLCGLHNNWGNSGIMDTPMIWDDELELYVAYDAYLTEKFKVRSNNSWEDNYGSNGWVTVDSYEGTLVSSSDGNCRVGEGYYDVYFSLSATRVWVMTPGSEAPNPNTTTL